MSARRRDDLDLMQYFDGELSPEEHAQVAAQLDATEADRTKLQALDQVGECLRTHLEVASDEAEDRLAAMWTNVERRIHANGVGVGEAAATGDEAARAAAAVSTGEPARQGGILAALRRWLDDYRGHFLTGAVTAGAVAALILVFRSPTERIIERPGVVVHGPTEARPAALPSPASVEELNVVEGTGHIITIPGEPGEADTTVIWIEADENSVEGPI